MSKEVVSDVLDPPEVITSGIILASTPPLNGAVLVPPDRGFHKWGYPKWMVYRENTNS